MNSFWRGYFSFFRQLFDFSALWDAAFVPPKIKPLTAEEAAKEDWEKVGEDIRKVMSDIDENK